MKKYNHLSPRAKTILHRPVLKHRKEKAFDKVWHEGPLQKIKQTFPKPNHQLVKPYLANRIFFVKYQDAISNIYSIEAGVSQDNVLALLLYTIYKADNPTAEDIDIYSFGNDSILATHQDPKLASQILQQHLAKIKEWLNRWKIKVNTDKYKHITFTIRKGIVPPITLNNTWIPQVKKLKYLELHLDSKLT